MQVVTASSNMEDADAELLRYAAVDLTRVSPTFRQLLEALRDAPHLVIRARTLGATTALGRGHFYVAGGRTIGMMEIAVHRGDRRLRSRAIAHELAHAVEVACLPPQPDTATLYRTLLERGRSSSGAPRGIETPFAAAVETAVDRETCRRKPPTGQLPVLAAKFGLPRCAGAVPAALQIASAQ